MLTKLQQAIVDVVNKIPYGRVMSYGQVASYVGVSHGARQVGWILRGIGPKVQFPWWRVINNKGLVTIRGNLYVTKDLQRKLLTSEGIKVNDEFKIDIERYRFKPVKNLGV